MLKYIGPINMALKLFIEWSSRYCLTLNPAKLYVTLFGLKHVRDRCQLEIENVYTNQNRLAVTFRKACQ